MADLLDLEGKPTGTVRLPDGQAPALISWAMRYFVRQPDGRYLEALPYVARENWPADWRRTFVERQMPNAIE